MNFYFSHINAYPPIVVIKIQNIEMQTMALNFSKKKKYNFFYLFQQVKGNSNSCVTHQWNFFL